MLAGMKVPATFAAPDPIAVSIHSGMPRAAVIERLERAVRERSYSKPGRNSPGFFRLGGSMTADDVTLTARPYVIPGLIAGRGAMSIELHGKVVASEDGSDIRGTINAPIGWAIPMSLGIALILWVIFGIASNGSTWPNLTFVIFGGLLLCAAWGWVIRHNQRRALRNVTELTRMLASIVEA